MDSNKKVSVGHLFTFMGAIVAYLIGSGFASGQESMQFFSVLGIKGSILALTLTMILYIWFSSAIMETGYRLQLESGNKVFYYYCGKYLGKFYEVYTAIFLFCVFVVMISGAGATLSEYYGLNSHIGRVAMALLAVTTVLLGLNNLVNVVSKIGPLIIVFGIGVGLTNIFLNPQGIANADSVLKNLDTIKAAPNWIVAGIIFPSMGCAMIAPFLATLGVRANSNKEAKIGAIFGACIFVIAVAVMSFGIVASIGDLYNKDVPSLVIAREIFPAVGAVFSLVLFAGMYTTAVPMLWISCNAIVKDEKSRKFRILVIVAGIVAFIVGQLPFAKLVNILYPISGYLGILFFICIAYKQIKEKLSSRKI